MYDDVIRILVTGRWADDLKTLLDAADAGLEVRLTDRATDADLAWADCYSGFAWPAGETRAVRWIHAPGLGLDGLADAPAPELLTRTVGSLPDQMARYVAGAVLSHVQRHAEFAAAQASGVWQMRDPRPWPLEALVLGTGLAASAVAETLRRLGVSVVGVNRSGRPAPGFGQLVTWADVDARAELPPLIVDLLPLTEQTRGRLGASFFDRCRDALFINVGRGATVDERALLDALEDGRVEGAWLDVFATEPLPTGHWAWTHPRVRLTPHVAAISFADEIADTILDAVAALRAGERPATAVDPAAFGLAAASGGGESREP